LQIKYFLKFDFIVSNNDIFLNQKQVKQMPGPKISVIMPTYNQGAFIRRALTSLLTQKFQDWELILINDGSTDYTEDVIEDYVDDVRIRYIKNESNKGLGYCLNFGMVNAKCNNICYLPSDDIYYADHLSVLYETLSINNKAVLCYSGLRYDNSDNYGNGLSIKKSLGKIADQPLQLVQVIHKKTGFRWVEREEFVTWDLDKMFWDQLQQEGLFVGTNIISCEWVNHPLQRHKIINEEHGGGIALYKEYYAVKEPLKFYTGNGKCIDEREISKQNGDIQLAPGKLKILIVGEASFNPERLCAFEDRGHKLFGLWIPNPDFHNSVGPFSFGNITDLNLQNFKAQIEEIKPDIIYALLNTQAVKLAHYILLSMPHIPFVWHFKEGPMFCRNMGIWKELFELFYNADGRIYINQQCKDWFVQFIGDRNRPSHILDGDLPPARWFGNDREPLLSDIDGSIHTLISGRPYGLTPQDVLALAKHNVHLHLYGEFYHSKWKDWIDEINTLAPQHLHLHAQCKPEDWTKEFSGYDAGWLHCFKSENNGELIKCSWDDLNYPARMSTLAAAGLPMIQSNNDGHLVATQTLIKPMNSGIFFDSIDDLGRQLNDRALMNMKRKAIWENRMQFSFDYHIDDLLLFFKEVIKMKQDER
jgi:glycosyltransferase involved in cell wall biosynthesis